MFKKSLFLLFLITSIFWSCENDVELTTDFEEKTVVFGLLDASQDTQFIKINRTFLEGNTSALDLAKDPSRLFYDSVSVSLIESGTNRTIELQRISRPKNSGVFNSDVNFVYFTPRRIKQGHEYTLSIKKLDGSVTTASTFTIFRISSNSPFLDTSFSLGPFTRSIGFVNETFGGDNQIQVVNFDFRLSRRIKEFEVNMEFIYTEVIRKGPFSADSIERRVSLPIGRVTNPNEFDFSRPNQTDDIKIPVDGNRFIQAIESQVPASTTPTNKVIKDNWNIEITIVAADNDYSFYRDLNGPIDGLAQTRPEFTNVNNGIGLFACRYTLKGRTQINGDTRRYLVRQYKDNRNFVFP